MCAQNCAGIVSKMARCTVHSSPLSPSKKNRQRAKSPERHDCPGRDDLLQKSCHEHHSTKTPVFQRAVLLTQAPRVAPPQSFGAAGIPRPPVACIYQSHRGLNCEDSRLSSGGARIVGGGGGGAGDGSRNSTPANASRNSRPGCSGRIRLTFARPIEPKRLVSPSFRASTCVGTLAEKSHELGNKPPRDPVQAPSAPPRASFQDRHTKPDQRTIRATGAEPTFQR